MKMEKQNKKKQLQKNYTLMNTSKQIHNAKYDMIVLSQLIWKHSFLIISLLNQNKCRLQFLELGVLNLRQQKEEKGCSILV